MQVCASATTSFYCFYPLLSTDGTPNAMTEEASGMIVEQGFVAALLVFPGRVIRRRLL